MIPAGTYTALITPFHAGGSVNIEAFKALIDRQAAAGITGIVPVGTTGESTTLSKDEHLEVIRIAIEHNAGRMKVIAGTGANATSEAIRLTREAEAMGADGTLQVCPYYNKPSQEGIYQHYKTIADSTKLPVMLYSVPGRCVVEVAEETIARLARDCQNITCTKEAGGRPERVTSILEAAPAGHDIFCGDDPLTLDFMSRGAKGLVSVSSNLVPEVMVSLVNALLEGRTADAQAVHDKNLPLFDALMGLDSNPVPIKTACALATGDDLNFRLPLVPMPEEKVASLTETMKEFSLIS